MDKVDFQKLVNRAGEMALRNMWGESAYKINKAILRLDHSNSAAYTRLAKYYKLNDNIADAEKMYIKALEIDPSNRGALNNLSDIEKDKQEKDYIDQMKTGGELFKAGQSSVKKGKFELAAKLFSKAYNTEPILKYAIGLAGVYKKMGKHDNVEKLYRELIDAKNPKTDIDVINAEFSVFIREGKSLVE